MTRRRIKIAVAEGVGVVRGWGAGDLLEAAGIKPFFAGGGWLVDEHRLPDLLAELERRHIAVDVTGVLLPQEKTASDGQRPDGTSSFMDVPLWGGEAS